MQHERRARARPLRCACPPPAKASGPRRAFLVVGAAYSGAQLPRDVARRRRRPRSHRRPELPGGYPGAKLAACTYDAAAAGRLWMGDGDDAARMRACSPSASHERFLLDCFDIDPRNLVTILASPGTIRIVPKSLEFYPMKLMELPAAPHGEQFDGPTHLRMLFQSVALWLRFKGSRKAKVTEA